MGTNEPQSQPKRATSRERSCKGRLLALILAPSLICALALPGSAAATSALAPTVATGPAHAVTYGSATLTASVNPKGSDTTYYFQYGPTKAYGGQTPLGNAGALARTITVEASVTGLQPLTVYYYRIVAVNAAGAIAGAVGDFRTAKIPLSLQILVSPKPVEYGGSILVQGTLSGTGNASREVVLQANAFPYTAGFATIGNPELTSSTGSFSFPVLGLTLATQYRVLTITKPQVLSLPATEEVAVRVVAHVGRARRHRRGRVRIYGTVTPAINGMQVGIMRVSHGRDVLVGGTDLLNGSATSSRFSKVVRARRGLYRVLVVVTNGAQTSAYSIPLLIR